MSRILLLEDDEALGRGICMALETPNCTVTHCSTRLQAIKILQGVVFDLLILDISLNFARFASEYRLLSAA